MSTVRVAPDNITRRIDLWLWFARFFKSRTMATRFVQSGRLRVNEKFVKKAHHNLCVGDILTFPRLDRIIVVKVLNLGTRRGPASEATSLYENISALTDSKIQPKEVRALPTGLRSPGSGRPTKRQRRALDRFRAD